MAEKELQTLEVITRDPKKYLLVNLEDGTFFQGQDQEEPDGVPDEVIRRRSSLMWRRPDDKTLLCAINVLTEALETGEDRGTTNS